MERPQLSQTTIISIDSYILFASFVSMREMHWSRIVLKMLPTDFLVAHFRNYAICYRSTNGICFHKKHTQTARWQRGVRAHLMNIARDM